jgi:outer membrane immunogenic protein
LHWRQPEKAASRRARRGFYAGLNGGYAWGNSTWTDSTGATSGDFTVSGGMVGGTVGYNLQMSAVVIGFEGDIDASWLKGSAATACCETKNDWFAAARARLGLGMDRFMPFVTAGAPSAM